VRVGHDPYLLLCLGFSAADTQGLTGDIYYPTQIPAGSSTLVFAPILRSACDWRPEYDRNFFKAFPGAGIHLGYIRVRILNADGRPYITHGHPVTVMLRAEVQTDTPQMGGPGHMVPIPQQCLPGAAMPYHPGGLPGGNPGQAQPYQTQNQTQGQTQEAAAAAAAAAATPVNMYPQFPGLWPMSNPGFSKY
jgi:hypothetical protein